MHSFTSLVTFGTLATLALAKPLPQTTTTKKGFSITGSVARPRPHPVVQLSNALSRYGGYVPDNVASAAAAAASGEVTATPEASDVAYLSPVTIGGQKLNLDFDTGSADL